MKPQPEGKAAGVFNPLNISRADVGEASVKVPRGRPNAVRGLGPDGREVPAQLSNGKVLFLAKTPSVGYAVYDVQPVDASANSSTLKVTESSLENARYRVTLDRNGDVSSIFDKALNKDLLSAPARLAIKTDRPEQWRAW